MELYSHNKEAYDAVMKHYAEGNKKAAIVHATGTGKSYIIGAVSEHFKKVLVIAPNNFVLDETRKVCHDGCEFRTYASVMYNEGEQDLYDLIVLDEFHRGGAEKWGEGVRRLIEANPNSLLLGTSATHIRYLDNQRNMADELFDGNVVSQLPLKEAIERRILPNPTYVSSIYSIYDTVRSRKQKIKQCRKKNVDKEELCRRLEGIAHNWENAGGVPRIIRKYFTHDMQRVIVFCSKVARAAEARKLLSRWFGLAGFNRVRYYNIDYKETRLEREMKDFQEPLGEYDLKVAISVNMLNEGIHIPHVDGVIMLRSTVSRIIIEQQVGRCLTSNNVGINPVVLDLVNNMDMIQYDEPIFIGEYSTSDNIERKEYKYKGFPFNVIDECRDMRILLEQLDKDITYHKWNKEECLESAQKFNFIKLWVNAFPNAYSAALRNGWLKECTAHMNRLWENKWDKDSIIEDARKYKTRKEWRVNNEAAYQAANKHGFLPEATAHMERIWQKKWDKESVFEDARKYNTLKEWRTKSSSAYTSALNMGIVDEASSHMKKRKIHKWTKEEVLASALKFNSREEWKKNDSKAYASAFNNGWIEDATRHMKPLRLKWTKDSCKSESIKYSTRIGWKKGNNSSYRFACKHGWLDECCAHMVKSKTTNKKKI